MAGFRGRGGSAIFIRRRPADVIGEGFAATRGNADPMMSNQKRPRAQCARLALRRAQAIAGGGGGRAHAPPAPTKERRRQPTPPPGRAAPPPPRGGGGGGGGGGGPPPPPPADPP